SWGSSAVGQPPPVPVGQDRHDRYIGVNGPIPAPRPTGLGLTGWRLGGAALLASSERFVGRRASGCSGDCSSSGVSPLKWTLGPCPSSCSFAHSLAVDVAT